MWTHRLVAVLLLATALLVSPPLADEAFAAVDIRVHEWNACGAACNSDSDTPANIVIFAVVGASPRPWSVSLNEVCLNSRQFGKIVNFLDDYGYTGNYYIATTTPNCGGSSYFGNLVLDIGPLRRIHRTTFPTQAPEREQRGVVCNQSGNLFGDWYACSTHLDNDATYARAQEDQLYNYVTFSLANLQVKVVGGDFNLAPGNADFNKWRTNYDEIDEVAPFASTHDSLGKIDYIWMRDYGTMTSPYAPILSPIVESDHHYYDGRFRWLA